MLVVVVEQDVAVGVEAGDAPESVAVLGTQVLSAGSLPGGQDLEVGCLVDILLDESVVVDPLDEEKFLNG